MDSEQKWSSQGAAKCTCAGAQNIQGYQRVCALRATSLHRIKGASWKRHGWACGVWLCWWASQPEPDTAPTWPHCFGAVSACNFLGSCLQPLQASLHPPYDRTLTRSHVNGWKILGLSGDFQKSLPRTGAVGREGRPHRPARWQLTLGSREETANKVWPSQLGSHSSIESAQLCAPPPPERQSSCTNSASQCRSQGNGRLQFTVVVFLSQELLEQLRAVLKRWSGKWSE